MRIRHIRLRALLAAGVVAAGLIAVADRTEAASTRVGAAAPDIVSGPVSCPRGTSYAGNFVLDTLADGVVANGWIRISRAAGTQFDWAFTDAGRREVDMAVVIVQGGGQSAIYTYDYLEDGGDNADTALTAPGKATINRVEFCFDDKNLRDIINEQPGGSGGGGGGGSSSGGGGGGIGSGSGSSSGGGGGGGTGADLAVTGIVQPSVANVGETIVWRINVVDKNLQPATGVNVALELAGAITYAEGKTTRGSGCKAQSPTAIICNLDYLSKDSQIGSIVVLTPATGPGDYSLKASVSFSQADPVPEDNTLILRASSSKSGNVATTGTRPKSSKRFLTGATSILRGKLKGRNVVFSTSVRLTKPARLVVSTRDVAAKKRLLLQPGSRVGASVRKKPGRSLSKRFAKAGKVRTVVVVRRSHLVTGRNYRLAIDGIGVDGRGQKMTRILRW